MPKIFIAVASDTHIGSTVGLSVPEFMRDDGEVVRASAGQMWLWECWEDYWQTVKSKLAPDDKLIVVLNGDLVDGPNHHSTNQSMSSNSADEFRLVLEVLEPIRAMANSLYIVRGTPSHVGTAAHQEEKIAISLQAERDGPRRTFSFLPLEVEGLLFHFAHHGRVGKLPTNRNQPAILEASRHILRSNQLRVKPADVIVRSHRHQYADSMDTFSTRVLQTPCWQLRTEFVNRVVPDITDMEDIGGLLFTIEDGDYDVRWIGRRKYIPPQREVIRVA